MMLFLRHKITEQNRKDITKFMKKVITESIEFGVEKAQKEMRNALGL